MKIPLNFTQDFLPERSLLSKLMQFAQSGQKGNKEEIGEITGIPTGKSSGKVEAIIFYALGMGLISAKKEGGKWSLGLTELGNFIYSEDRYLSEPLTLWLLHLMLCRRHDLSDPARGTVDAWFSLFADGNHRLGSSFEQETYTIFLTERHGKKNYLKGLTGQVLRTYLEPKCFGLIQALTLEMKKKMRIYHRNSAPVDEIYFPAYTAYLFLIWDELYPKERQIAFDELNHQSRIASLLLWEKSTLFQWLQWMSDNRILQLDRQTGGTLILRLQSTSQIISNIFKNLI
jgi:hypothetical protein